MNTSALGDISVTVRAKPIKASDYIDGITDKEAEAYDNVTACLLANPEWSEANAVKHTKTNWLLYRDAKNKAVARGSRGRSQRLDEGFRPDDPILRNYGKGPIGGAATPKTQEEVELKLVVKKLGRPVGAKTKPKEPEMISADTVAYDAAIEGVLSDFIKMKESKPHEIDCDCQACVIKPGYDAAPPSKQEVLAKQIAKEFEKSLDKREKAVVQEFPAKLKAPDVLTDRTVMFAMIDLIEPFDEATRKRIIKGMVAFCGVEL